MSFDTDGFLGEEDEIIKKNYILHKEIFDICEETNRFAQNIKYEFKFNEYDRQGIIATTIFIKILNTFQSIVIMYKHGLSSQAKILVRTAIESLCVLRCILKDEKYIKYLVDSDSKKREKLLKRIKLNPHGVFNVFINEVDLSQLDNLIEENKRNNARIIDAKEWSEISESYNEYYYAYDILCGDVHVDIRNVEQYIKVDEEGQIKEFDIQPNTNDIKEVLLHTANYVLIESIKCMVGYAGIKNENFNNKINDFERRTNL